MRAKSSSTVGRAPKRIATTFVAGVLVLSAAPATAAPARCNPELYEVCRVIAEVCRITDTCVI